MIDLSLYVSERNPSAGESDLMSFVRIPPLPGHYVVGPIASHWYFPTEPSVTLTAVDAQGRSRELYSVSDSLESYIDVEYVNPQTNEWKFTFHLEMVLYRHLGIPAGEMAYPEKFTISQGFAKGQFPE